MKLRRFSRACLLLALGLSLVMASGFTRPALASAEDVALFYEELSQYGQWVDYENYGPVWHPTQVEEEWRPYANGRWVPSEDGYVFETQEPWGWATYHYGNWMPTGPYGWCWVPGRTWYPNTVTWRTSPEAEAVDASYIGWAPIPPPNYVPPQGYYPPNYYSGMPMLDQITAPFWIFAQAASFLLGFGQPYSPAYSYYGCGCLAPPTYVPTFFYRTIVVSNYYTPTYYPTEYIGRRIIAYNWGPPIPYVARVTRIHERAINRTLVRNTRNFTRIHNVMAPRAVVNRHPHLRQIYPPALVEGRRLPAAHRARNMRLAQGNLTRPNIVPLPAHMPRVTARIPRAERAAQPVRGVVGANLPRRAMQTVTPRMDQEIRRVPAHRQIVPTRPLARPAPSPRPGVPATAPPPGRPARPRVAPPGPPAREVRPGPPTRPTAKPTPPGPPTREVRPGPPTPSERWVTPTRPTARPSQPPPERRVRERKPTAPPSPPEGRVREVRPQPQPRREVRPQPQPRREVRPQPQPRREVRPQPPREASRPQAAPRATSPPKRPSPPAQKKEEKRRRRPPEQQSPPQ
jgi:hypothetical protein